MPASWGLNFCSLHLAEKASYDKFLCGISPLYKYPTKILWHQLHRMGQGQPPNIKIDGYNCKKDCFIYTINCNVRNTLSNIAH